MLLVVSVIAQGEVPVIPDFNDLTSNFGSYMAAYLGVAAIASFLGEYVIRLLKSTSKTVKIIVVSVVAVAVSFLGSLINIGYLAEAVWYEAIIMGVLSGVTAVGLRGTNLLFFKSVVDFVIGLIKAKEPVA